MSQSYFQRTPLLNGDDADAKRAEIRAYFHTTLDRYENLFETLSQDEAYYRKPISLRHPLIFYYGHTATFFINKLILTGVVTERIDPALESIFAVGVDEMSWDDLDTTHYKWPEIEAVRNYRSSLRMLVDKLISDLPLVLPITWESPWWVILMGIEHERIHLETSSVLIRQHALDYVQPHPDWEPCRESGAAPQNQLIEVAPGTIQLGKDAANPGTYGWDNEFGRHETAVPAFEASRYLVSNQEFLAFVLADGYTTAEYWEQEGRAWQQFSGAVCPPFWVQKGSEWQLRLMTEVVPMPWNWPVDVNYHEAKAFCNWKSASSGVSVRLPTEDEWYRLYDAAGLSAVPSDESAQGNLHLDYYASSCPVDKFRQGEFYDIVGNVWQWTETPIYPLDGFKVHPIYDDFTTPTFDNQHNLIKGGSWIACGNESLYSARYAFRRHFFQHAGFRYVVTDTPPEQRNSQYETDKLLAEYAEFHYGDSYFDVPNFPATLARLAITAMAGRPAHRALDLGCAAGRATFELARHFDQVTGVDFSARFINQGVQLVQQGVLRYALTDEGDLLSYKERTLASLELDDLKGSVEFYQGDGCNLKPIFSDYDLILASNLLDRLYDPAKLLDSIHTRLRDGGLLIIASPYTWLPEHTEKKAWIGGYKKDGENFTTLDGLKEILGKNFDLIQGPQSLPFVIRETKRKFQHSLSEVTIWAKRSCDAAKPTRAQPPCEFDQHIDRTGSNCIKFDERQSVFGRSDVIPLWVADMDFAAPPAVSEALIARARHPIYGYTQLPESLYESLINWVQQRHGWTIQREWIVICPGVVPSLNAAVQAFTNIGDPVIIQPPVYHPFFSAISSNGRKLLLNPLHLKDGRYTMDFDHLTQCAPKAQLLLLCSPHNPVGRVWDKEELARLLEIAEKHDLLIISDEIHADLIYPGCKHQVTAALTENPARVITALAPSKTFNIAGMNLSALIIPDKNQRARMIQTLETFHVSASNPFSIVAFETAYRTGETWLTALLDYLQATRECVEAYLTGHLPSIKVIQPQGTYLLWLDCRGLHMSDAQLKHFFIHAAGLGMNPGVQFGEKEGSGFMRLNIGAPRAAILTALRQIKGAMQ